MGGVSMEWKEVKIGDLGQIITGKTPKTAIRENWGGKIPFLSPSDDMSNKTSPVTARTLTELGVAEVAKCLIPANSICVSCIGSDLGKVVKTDRELVTNQQINTIVPYSNVDSDFVYYLMCIVGKELNYISKTSTAVPIINKSTFSDWNIVIPEKVEDQRRIASILSSLDRKIELNNKINGDLEEMAQAIFKNWFVDFEPFKDGKFVDSELGMIPEGWKVGCLGDMGAVVCGKTPSKSNSNYYEGDIPFIKIPDMHGNVFVENSEDRLTEEGSLSQIKKLIPPYSLMVSCIATVGLVSINTKPSHTNQQINTVIPHNKSALFYLYQHIKNNEEFLKNMGRGGTTTLNVNTKSFSNIRLLIPSEIALDQFHGIVEGLFKKIELNMHESRTLSLLRDTLLPRLMSGEIEVPE